MHQVYYFYSCYNNYDILIGEQADFLLSIKHQIIILDDHSSEDEQEKGRHFCEENDLKFVVNRYKGLQMGIQYLAEEIVPDAKWLVCMQQDTFLHLGTSSSEYLCNRLMRITENDLPIGAVGFQNFVKNSHYNTEIDHTTAFSDLQTWLGVFFLSPSRFFVPKTIFHRLVSVISRMKLVSNFTKKFRHKLAFNRNFAPLTYPSFDQTSIKYKGIASIELPVWAAIALNLDVWRSKIKPDPDFVFHLWFPDVAMQLMSQNIHVCLDSEIHLINDVNLKSKYGQLGSVEEGQKANTSKMERYGGHLRIFERKWGFDYEFIYSDVEAIRQRYKNTLVGTYIDHDPRTGPIKVFEI